MNGRPSKLNSSPVSRAYGGIILFACFGVFGVILAWPNLENAWPLVVFYAMLLLNDYFSIKHFSKIIPPGVRSQMIIDGALVVLHFLSVFSFNDPRNFYLAVTILFILATLKYSYDISLVKEPHLLYRKIKVDALGALASAIATTGILFGYTWSSTITWTAIFAFASIYVIYINPLYKDTLGAS